MNYTHNWNKAYKFLKWGEYVKIEHLEYLITISQTNSLTSAGEKLFITQQALGIIVKNMEEELHTKILIRTAQGVSFTENGKKILKFAQNTVAEYYSLCDSFKPNTDTIQGRLIFHYSPAFASSKMKSFLEKFLSHYPEVTLYSYSNDVYPAYELLRKTLGDITFGLFVLPYDSEEACVYPDFLPPKGYNISILSTFRYSACVSKKSSFASYKKISIHTLLQRPLVTLATSDYLYDTALLYSVKQYTNSYKISYATPSVENFVHAILNDKGVTLGSPYFSDTNKEGLMFIPIKEKIEAAVCLIFPQVESSLADIFIEKVFEHFGAGKY